MAITYVNDLRLSEMGTGDNSGTWGTVTNTNLELIGEALGFGTEAITTNADTHASTIADGSTDPVRAMYVKYTGTLDSACTITIGPNTVNKFYYIENATSGSQNIIISQGSGANVTIPAGDVKAVYLDGAGSGAAVTDAFASLSVVDLKVQDDLTVTDDMTVGGTLAVSGLITANANITLAGTTPTLTIGDAGAEDIKIVFDGNAQDFYIGLDDSADDLIIGHGSTVGTTPAISIDNNTITTIQSATNSPLVIKSGNSTGGYTEYKLGANGATNGYLGSSEELISGGAAADLGIRAQANLAFATNGNTERLRISSAGLVGIGTNDPKRLVHLNGGSESVKLQITNSTTGSSSDGDGFQIGIATNGTANLEQREDADMVFSTDNTARMTLDSNGLLLMGAAGGNSTGIIQGSSGSGSTNQPGTDLQLKGGAGGGTGGSSIKFFTAPGGSSGTSESAAVERFKISTDGSLSTPTAGTSNVRFGVNAGNSIVSGAQYNVCIGDEAGTAISTGDNNTAVGYKALENEDTNGSNTAIGFQALEDQNGGDGNTAVGANALENLTNASRCTAVGNSAGLNSQGADDVVFIGHDAGKFATTATNSVFIGSQAGQGVGATPLTGNNNVIIGESAGLNIQGSATLNTYVGTNAGLTATTVSNNTFIGAFAGDSATSGDNTGVGSGALGGSLTGDQNTAVGHDAANGLTSGTDNVMIGHLAGVSATECGDCVMVGEQAGGGAVVTGNRNTFIGRAAGYSVTSGENNVLLGNNAGRASAPGGNHTDGDNSIVIGDNSSANAYIKIDWTVTSDERDKTDFNALDLGLDFVKSMKPYTFKWDQRSDYGDSTADNYKVTDQNPDGTHKKDQLDVGFKAQDIEALEKAAGYKISDKTNLVVSLTQDETQYGLKYSKFIPILVKAIQEQNTLIEALTARVATLEG